MKNLQHLFSYRATQTQPSAIREMCKLVARPEVKSLAGGWPDPAVFPTQTMQQCLVDVIQTMPERAFQYCQVDGIPELRQTLADWCQEREGLPCSPDRVMIVQGSQQGVDLAARVFVNPGDIALVGLPTYMGGFGALGSAGGRVMGVKVDGQGIDPLDLERAIREARGQGGEVKALYAIPNFTNPTGADWPLERRQQVLEVANRHDLVVIEDDPYAELRYDGDYPPSLKHLDTDGRVIHVRSMSKTISPGLRLGWVVAEPDILTKMGTLKQFTDTSTNTLVQLAINLYIERGHFARGIEQNVAFYRQKRDLLLELMGQHFPAEVTWRVPRGGFFVWVRLPQGLDGTQLMREAAAQNVAFVPGEPFFVDGGGQRFIRLSFAQANAADTAQAVAQLGGLLRQRLDQAA